MNKRRHLMVQLRIVLLAFIGIIQISLVFIGCVSFCRYLQRYYPSAVKYSEVAYILALLSTIYIWLRFLALESAAKLRSIIGDPNAAVDKLVEVLLADAVRRGVDKIILGEPTQPYEIEQRKVLTRAERVEAGTMTKAEKLEADALEQKFVQLKQEGDKLDKESERLHGPTRSPFHTSAVTGIPTWYRLKGKWQQMADLPVRILSEVMSRFEWHSTDFYCLKSAHGKTTHKVRYSVGMETNFCYSISINEVESVE